ncbi:hypothetical protein [Campylobacter sp. VTCC 70190]|uniref:hypothetical protein n=1 Tax=Campylobacter sp. VTCC 70190 TaxID=3392118 RepID=UPI00398E5BBD
MLLAGIIFVFNVILAYLSIDISKLDERLEQLKLVLFASIFILSLTLLISSFKRNKNTRKIHQKIFSMQNDFLNFEKKSELNDVLDLLKEKLENMGQNWTKISHEKDKYLHLLEENLYQLGNIADAMRCLNETYDKEINTLILNALNSQKEQIRLELNQALEHHKSIIGTSKGKVLRFEASVAIVSNDELESFLLANLLSYFGVESTCFKNLSFDVNDFHLVFVKDKILENMKKNYDFIVITRHKNTHYEYFLTLPFEKKELENILRTKLDKLCALKFKTPYQNNVLLFKQNDFDANLFFNIIEKQCDKNICINSFTQLKQELAKQTYRLILLDYELIKFDLEQMRNLLSAYKKQHPQSHIIFFSKEKLRDFDCVSEVLGDVSKNELIALLRKYLPKA